MTPMTGDTGLDVRLAVIHQVSAPRLGWIRLDVALSDIVFHFRLVVKRTRPSRVGGQDQGITLTCVSFTWFACICPPGGVTDRCEIAPSSCTYTAIRTL